MLGLSRSKPSNDPSFVDVARAPDPTPEGNLREFQQHLDACVELTPEADARCTTAHRLHAIALWPRPEPRTSRRLRKNPMVGGQLGAFIAPLVAVLDSTETARHPNSFGARASFSLRFGLLACR